MQNLEHTELTQPVLLCQPNGQLNPQAAGWIRHPLITGNLSGHALRKKKWNYWCIISDKYLYSITISDIDYLGLVFVYYMDFETGAYGHDTLTIPFARGIQMGPQVADPARYSSAKATVAFTQQGNQIQLSTRWQSVQGQSLQSEITIQIPPAHETLNVVVPWSQSRFQYTSKQHCLPATGYFTVGNKTHHFTADQHAFACLDFGRGVWPYAIKWNWGAFSAVSAGHTIGFNSGDKWTNGTGITENSVGIDGVLYKITGPVQWHYNRQNFMQPWRMQGDCGQVQVNLTFSPFFDRTDKTNLVLLRSEVHQCFGKYNGTITVNGTVHNITNVTGWAEEHDARW